MYNDESLKERSVGPRTPQQDMPKHKPRGGFFPLSLIVAGVIIIGVGGLMVYQFRALPTEPPTPGKIAPTGIQTGGSAHGPQKGPGGPQLAVIGQNDPQIY